MEGLYSGIDLHSNNSVVVVKEAGGKVVYRRRLDNDLQRIESALAPYRERLKCVAVESTFNWYWLVDGLEEAGYAVSLVNTAAIQQYQGLKHSDDHSDAEWLAEMARLGILRTGYIYPKEQRAVRDLLRKRAHLVRQRTANILSVQNLVQRNLGRQIKGDAVKAMDPQEPTRMFASPEVALAVSATVRVRGCLDEQIAELETGEAAGRVRKAQDHSRCGRHLGADDHARDGRDLSLPCGGQLRLVLPLCGQQEDEQLQEEGGGKRQERQSLPGMGIHRGGQLRHPLLGTDPALLSAQEVPDQRRSGDQGGGAQAGAGGVLHLARRSGVRCEPSVLVARSAGAVSQGEELAHSQRT